jgi:outer membrane protein
MAREPDIASATGHALETSQGAKSPGQMTADKPTDLGDAIRAALSRSATMVIARSRLDGTRAQVVVARAGGLPSVDATLQYNRDLSDSAQFDRGLRAEASVNMPLYQGGTIHNGVLASKAQRDAADTRITEAEAEVVLATAQAYADVLKDRRIVALNRDNVANLEKMLAGVAQRLKARDLTRTDLDQAQSRLLLARGRLEKALASLEASEVEYQRLTGTRPGPLQAFPVIQGMPHDADDAVGIAIENNPALRAAQAEALSSRYSLKSARGALLPQVYATVNSSYAASPAQAAPGNREPFGTRIGVTMRMGLFQGGARNASIAIAAANATQSDQQVIDLERSVEAATRATYAEWMAARTLVEATRNAVAANEKALSGVRLENAVGTRTILDILNAEQELRDSQEQLATAERDVSVAAMAILATIGRGQADQLELRHPAPESPLPSSAEGSVQTPDAAAPDAARALVAASGPAPVAVPRPAAAAPPPGRDWVVQAGAFDTLDLATRHWMRIRPHAAALTATVRPAVYRAVIANKPWFRLATAGFADWQEAEAFCLSLKRQSMACLVRRASGLGEPVWQGPQQTRTAP